MSFEAFLLVAAVLLVDVLVGDPRYRLHPIRLIGSFIGGGERLLRSRGWNGYAGGVALLLVSVAVAAGAAAGVLSVLWAVSAVAGWIAYVVLGAHLVAVRDLAGHGLAIGRAADAGDLGEARAATGMLVGRDTERLDAAGCNRAAIESLGENLTDSVVAPLFYFTLFGLLGLLAFKVVSTADSMVGYKSERFRRVGWASARADDVLAFVPARLTWLLVVLAAAVLPGMSGRDAARCGVRQHALVPGPNAGWSEASTAGALRLRLVGDVWRDGVKVVDGIWLGREEDREAATLSDVRRAVLLIGVTTFLFMVVAFLVLAVAGVVPWPERLLAPWPPFGSTA